MMLYTRKGDTGTTKTFGAKDRISKSSGIAEALGTVDEINSFLGLCKVRSRDLAMSLCERPLDQIVHTIQQNLFIVQAELAGAGKTLDAEKVLEAEGIVDEVERTLPPITTFFISGSTEIGALFDVARTISRRAERRVVAVAEEGVVVVGPHTLAYLNRLSSILYALARLTTHLSGITEESPTYK